MSVHWAPIWKQLLYKSSMRTVAELKKIWSISGTGCPNNHIWQPELVTIIKFLIVFLILQHACPKLDMNPKTWVTQGLLALLYHRKQSVFDRNSTAVITLTLALLNWQNFSLHQVQCWTQIDKIFTVLYSPPSGAALD
jgi:hypothetical protein